MTTIDAVGHVLVDGVMYFHFNIVFDTENWIVTKSYDEFVELKRQLEEAYSIDQIPYLTGEVRPWARNSESTAISRLPKLELFLMELVVVKFKPEIFDINVPFVSKNKYYRISKFTFDFLQFAAHCRPVSSPPGRRGAQGESSFFPNGEQQSGEATVSKEPEETEEQRTTRERDAEIRKLRQKQKSSAQAIARSAEAATRTSITNQLKIQIVSFEIFERDRIDYVVSIELWDRTWYINKRYTEFVDMKEELVEIYGDKPILSIEASKAPFYKKLDPDTGKMRQLFFQKYLQDLVMEVDVWEPRGLMATFQVQAMSDEGNESPDGAEGPDAKKKEVIVNVAVSVNKVIFDFLNFQEHMSTINAYVARKVLARQNEQLPESVKKAMVAKQEAERRLKVISELQYRQRHRTLLKEVVVNELLDLLPMLQEDRDILNSIRYVTEYGVVCRDLSELDTIYPSTAGSFLKDIGAAGERGGPTSPRPNPTSSLNNSGTNYPNKASSPNKSAYEHPSTVKPSTTAAGRPTPNSAASAIGRQARTGTAATNNNGSNPFGALRVGTRRMVGTFAAEAAAKSESKAHDNSVEGDDDDWVSVGPSGKIVPTKDQKPNNTNNRSSYNGTGSEVGSAASSSLKGRGGHNSGNSSALNVEQQRSGSNSNASASMKKPTQSADKASNNSSSASPGTQTRVGITSTQAAKIAEAIFFNDTRKGGIAALAVAMVDDTHWKALFGTLIYEWDECQKDVEDVLIRDFADRERNQGA